MDISNVRYYFTDAGWTLICITRNLLSQFTSEFVQIPMYILFIILQSYCSVILLASVCCSFLQKLTGSKKAKKKKEENQRYDASGEETKPDESRSSKVISYGLKGLDGLNAVFLKFLIKLKELNYQVSELLFRICNCNNYF